MRILPTCLFLLLTINIINAQIFQGYQSGQTREKRQNNVYQFLRHLLASSGIPQENFPHDISSFYQPPGDHSLVVNVNHPDSKPTTIINNLHPEYFNQCPCERYVRGSNDELQCLCPKKRIYTKCDRNKVCVEKSYCDHGLLFDTRALQTVNRQTDLCDEITHVCCLPPTEVQHEITNHFVNTSIDRLNNTVTKYIIGGNLYLNNGDPTSKYKTKNQFAFPQGNQQVQPGQTTDSVFQQVQSNFDRIPGGQDQNAGIENQAGVSFMQQGFTGNQQIPASQIPVQTSNQRPIETSFPQQSFIGSQIPSGNQQFPENQFFGNTQFDANNPAVLSEEEKNPVHLNSVTSTTESILHTTPIFMNPTSPPVISTSPAFHSKVKEQQFVQPDFTNDITTYRPSTTTKSDDLFNPNELASIFGSPDVTEFPGLPLQSPNEDQNTQSVGVSIIENAPLSQMDFPQPMFQAPMRQPELFLTGKIEKFRNNSRKNATSPTSIATRPSSTTTETVVPGIRQRISVGGVVNARPTAPAFTQVQEQEMFSFQESTPAEYTPPTTRPSNFQAPASTSPILRACPTAMKCVQEMYCTPDGIVSTVPVILTKEEEIRKTMLLTCGDEASGQIGKCCFDQHT